MDVGVVGNRIFRIISISRIDLYLVLQKLHMFKTTLFNVGVMRGFLPSYVAPGQGGLRRHPSIDRLTAIC